MSRTKAANNSQPAGVANAHDAPAILPVTLTVAVSATRRADLPDVFTAELEQSGRVVTRRHFREGSEGPEDVTDLVAEILLERARRRVDGEHGRQAEQVARVGAVSPERHRRDVVVEGTMRAGQSRARALTALATLNGRGLLTMRQFEAGDRLGQDAKVVAGARDASDDEDVGGGGGSGLAVDGGRSWEDFAVAAAMRMDAARQACQDAGAFDGAPVWGMVEAVVLREATLTQAAGGTARSVQRRAKAALRVGLEAVGDVYGLRPDVTTTQVLADGMPVPLVFCEDRDGLDRNEALCAQFRAVSLGGRRWRAVADTMSELYAAARAELRSRENTA